MKVNFGYVDIKMGEEGYSRHYQTPDGKIIVSLEDMHKKFGHSRSRLYKLISAGLLTPLKFNGHPKPPNSNEKTYIDFKEWQDIGKPKLTNSEIARIKRKTYG